MDENRPPGCWRKDVDKPMKVSYLRFLQIQQPVLLKRNLSSLVKCNLIPNQITQQNQYERND